MMPVVILERSRCQYLRLEGGNTKLYMDGGAELSRGVFLLWESCFVAVRKSLTMSLWCQISPQNQKNPPND